MRSLAVLERIRTVFGTALLKTLCLCIIVNRQVSEAQLQQVPRFFEVSKALAMHIHRMMSHLWMPQIECKQAAVGARHAHYSGLLTTFQGCRMHPCYPCANVHAGLAYNIVYQPMGMHNG